MQIINSKKRAEFRKYQASLNDGITNEEHARLIDKSLSELSHAAAIVDELEDLIDDSPVVEATLSDLTAKMGERINDVMRIVSFEVSDLDEPEEIAALADSHKKLMKFLKESTYTDDDDMLF